MRNITPNSRKAYWILLEYQLNHLDDAGNRGPFSLAHGLLCDLSIARLSRPFCAQSSAGMRFNEYLGVCQENFAAHDETRLRTYMKEFFDHKLMVAKTVSVCGCVFRCVSRLKYRSSPAMTSSRICGLSVSSLPPPLLRRIARRRRALEHPCGCRHASPARGHDGRRVP